MLGRSKHGVLSNNAISVASQLLLGRWNGGTPSQRPLSGPIPALIRALAHSEWQTFIGCDCQQYLALVQRLSQARTSDQIASAYTDYWCQETESCGRELCSDGGGDGRDSKMNIAARIVPDVKDGVA